MLDVVSRSRVPGFPVGVSALPKTTGAAVLAGVHPEPEAGAGSLEHDMDRFVDGDARAFEDLYHRLAPRLERSLRFMTGDRHLAQDLTQTTFLKVLRARDTYQRGMAVKAWVWTIARRTYLDERRRRSRNREVLVADPDPPPAEAGELASTAHLERAIAALPPAQREALVLLKVHELSADEAAAAAGTTAGAIKMRAQRAYQTLRRILSAGER
jgi:RNA polymerase sigma-70 factor, ECF subfamily